MSPLADATVGQRTPPPVKIVSGNIVDRTQTATLVVEAKYQGFEQTSAFAVSAVLALAAMTCLVVISILRPKEDAP